MMIELDAAAFRAMFPEFTDPAAWPDGSLSLRFVMATGYVSADTYGCMPVEVRTGALYLMTAHLLVLGNAAATGGTAAHVTQSKVGDVSVSLAQPPFGTSMWRYWLGLTPYGLQLLALLEAQAVGGFYVGGLPERGAFRKVGGVF